MGRSNKNKKIKRYINARWQTSAPHGSKLHVPPTIICQLLNKRQRKSLYENNISGEEKKGEWKINRKMTGGKQQQDCAEEQKGRRSERGNAMKAMMCIPDRRETSAIPSLPSRELLTRQFSTRSVLCTTVITPHAS